MDRPRVRIVDAHTVERPVTMRVPFRFGAATVTETNQAFLHLVVEIDGRRADGIAAELMVPKWFDKNPDLSNADNVAQLRRALALAIEVTAALPAATAFGLHAEAEGEQHRRCADEGLNPLIASFGLALVDRAVLDAMGRSVGRSVAALVRANIPAIEPPADLRQFDADIFLAALEPRKSIRLRHTIGFADPLTPAEVAKRLDDGLPECLTEEIAHYGVDRFKIKLSGDPEADVARLRAIAAVLDGQEYLATLDGNEQYYDEDDVVELIERIDAEPKLARLRGSLLFVEQPMHRDVTLAEPVRRAAALVPLAIDEADGTDDAFLTAYRLGYRGVSSKSCKGFYRALRNAMRASAWTGTFLSAEDLTTQAGVSVQQDLLLAGLIGLEHVERNGHHYVGGMSGASDGETAAFLADHADLYEGAHGRARLRPRDGLISLRSVMAAPGLGVSDAAAAAVLASLTMRAAA